MWLDRYMKENQVWATQLRAQQSVAAGTVRRLKERLEALTMYQVSRDTFCVLNRGG